MHKKKREFEMNSGPKPNQAPIELVSVNFKLLFFSAVKFHTEKNSSVKFIELFKS